VEGTQRRSGVTDWAFVVIMGGSAVLILASLVEVFLVIFKSNKERDNE